MTVTVELTAEEMLSAWGSAEVKNTFFVPGNVRIQRTLLCQALFLDIFESAWDGADATNTSFPGTSYGKSAGENAEAKNTFLPGTFLLKY